MKLLVFNVFSSAIETIAKHGEQGREEMVMKQRPFIERLAERLELSPKSAQTLYVAMVRHGYMTRWEKKVQGDYVVCATDKMVQYLADYYDRKNEELGIEEVV